MKSLYILIKKLAFLICITSIGLCTKSCSDDEKEDSQSTEITLLVPEDGLSIDLASGDITFVWETDGTEISAYTMIISEQPDLSDGEQFVTTKTAYELEADEFNSILTDMGVAAEETKTLYWSVKPTSSKIEAVLPQPRSLLVKSLAGPIIALQSPSNGESIDLQVAGKIVFAWTSVAGVGSYNFVWGTAADKMTNKLVAGVSPWEVSAAQITEWLKDVAGPGETIEIFWSIKPLTDDIEVATQVRKVTITLPQSTTALELIAPENETDIVLKQWKKSDYVEFKWNETVPTGSKLVLSKTVDFTNRIEIDVTNLSEKSISYEELQAMIDDDANGLSKTEANTLYWNLELNGEIFSYLTRTFTLTGWDPKLIYESDFSEPLPGGQTLPSGWELEGKDAMLGFSDGAIIYSNNNSAGGSHPGKKVNYRLPASLKNGSTYKFTTKYKVEAENEQLYWFPQLNEIEGSWREFIWDGGNPSQDKNLGRDQTTGSDGSVTEITRYTFTFDVEKSRFSYMVGQFANMDKLTIYSLKIEIE